MNPRELLMTRSAVELAVGIGEADPIAGLVREVRASLAVVAGALASIELPAESSPITAEALRDVLACAIRKLGAAEEYAAMELIHGTIVAAGGRP